MENPRARAMGSNRYLLRNRATSLCSCMLFGTVSEGFEDAFNKNAAVKDRKSGHCSGYTQGKKADHSIEADRNQHEPHNVAEQETPPGNLGIAEYKPADD